MGKGESENYDLIVKLKQFQKILFEHYTNTKKILIATEGFGDFSNNEVFYNMLGVLDEVYLLINEKEKKNINKRLKRIEANLLIAQIYATLICISEIRQTTDHLCPSLIKETEKIKIKTKKILLKYKLVELEKKTDVLKLDNLLDIYAAADKLNILKDANKETIKQFEHLINLILPKWKIGHESWKGPIKLKQIEIDDDYLSTFQDFILQEYTMARVVLFDLLIKKGYHFNPSISDLRDCIDHIAKSLIYEPTDSTLELKFASEHIRRAAVESIQSYVMNDFEIINKIFLEKKKLSKSVIINWCKAKEYMCYGRYNKADATWYHSIIHFYNSLMYLEKVEKQLNKK